MPAFTCDDCNNNDCGNCVICRDKSVDFYDGDDYSESLYIPDDDD